MRESTICERDTQKMSKEDESFVETSLSNMISSTSFSFYVQYDQPPIFDEEDQVMTMDKGTEISLYLQH
jgi:hypothetical protein